ncbi:uridine-cytidine kinase 2-B-like isoform X2 [Harmonia axyridis]|nr:uridine-cytidine kinase 2-B-like isoform X2 [Harmonia axyridis]
MEKLEQEEVNNAGKKVVYISQFSFYRDLTPSEMGKTICQFGFDHPDAFDETLMKETLTDILAGKIVKIPTYDFKSHTLLKDELITIYPADVVLFEGISVFCFPEVRKLLHMKLFVDMYSDIRFARTGLRDIGERRREWEQPTFYDFCLPTMKFADIIIPRGTGNVVAIDLIVSHIMNFIHGKGGVNCVDSHKVKPIL